MADPCLFSHLQAGGGCDGELTHVGLGLLELSLQWGISGSQALGHIGGLQAFLDWELGVGHTVPGVHTQSQAGAHSPRRAHTVPGTIPGRSPSRASQSQQTRPNELIEVTPITWLPSLKEVHTLNGLQTIHVHTNQRLEFSWRSEPGTPYIFAIFGYWYLNSSDGPYLRLCTVCLPAVLDGTPRHSDLKISARATAVVPQARH